MDRDEHGPERTCIVTRRRASPDAMLRFVLGPDAVVVPDIRRRLPGRGVWVTASEATVAEADRPMTASEDFARFLEHVPGAFAFIGNGEGSAPLHSADYDFDDGALVHGMRLHAAIVRRRLGAA